MVIRLILFMAMPLEGLQGYGDLKHFFNLTQLGVPFFDFWVEFPPLFPFLSWALASFAGGQEHVYSGLLVMVLSLAQMGSLGLFIRFAGRLYSEEDGFRKGWVYFAVLVGLSYGWWYFDPLAVFFMLVGLGWVLEGRDVPAGLAIATGTLTKLFPILILPIIWRYRSRLSALKITVLSLGVTALVFGILYAASPEMTSASLRSQVNKGSWETVWALVDGNFHTGNFGPESQRYDPKAVVLAQGFSAKIPPWVTLIIFGALGAWFFRKWKSENEGQAVAFLGLTWVVFLLWSPGYSPQWTLYLLPLILLALPEQEAFLMAVTLVFLNLLEWPVLLSRGYFAGLWLTVPLRTILLILLMIAFWRVIKEDKIST
jgi:hypothetical protein